MHRVNPLSRTNFDKLLARGDQRQKSKDMPVGMLTFELFSYLDEKRGNGISGLVQIVVDSFGRLLEPHIGQTDCRFQFVHVIRVHEVTLVNQIKKVHAAGFTLVDVAQEFCVRAKRSSCNAADLCADEMVEYPLPT